VAELDELMSRAQSWSDPAVRLPALVSIAHHLLIRQGPSEEVDGWCAQCEVLADEVGSVPGKAVAALQRAMFLGEQGRLDAAGARIADATAIGGRLGPGSVTGIAAALVGELTNQHVEPDWARAGELTRGMASAAEPVFWGIACAAFAAHAFAKAGMQEDARQMLGHVTPVLTAGGLAPYAQSIGVSLAASAAAELGDAEHSANLLGCALSLFGEGDWYMASSELAAARLAATLGESKAAIEYFDRARGTLAARGQRPLAAIVDFEDAVVRRSARLPGAAGLMGSAQGRFAELGMTEWSRIFAEHSNGTGHGLPDDLTRREREVLRLVATGATNNEIAESLVVSVHTVERHLTNSYRKIGVRNRADATAYVLHAAL
jgi:ATP/maltotriose-dependent transcriptional regulator MalT